MIGMIADIHVACHKRHGGPVHAGINRRCQQILNALEVAVRRVRDRGCKGLVVLGDLFDTTNPPQQVVTEVQRILGDFPTWVLLGNHDQVSTAPGDHALGPLGPVVTVVEDPTVLRIDPGYELFFVPFRPGPAIDWLPAVLEEWCGGDQPKYKPGDNATLLLHLGISDVKTPAYMRGHHDVVSDALLVELCQQYGLKAAFAGNWHWHRVHRKKPLVCQVGTLAPTGWDNPGFDHGQVVYWDGQRMEVEQVPGPRFIKLGVDDDVEVPDGCQVYVEIKASQDESAAGMAMLQEALADGTVCAGSVVPDTEEVRAATKKAAMVARSAETMEEALSGFVEEMALDDGVDRSEVLATTRGYLEGV